jgi:REP element-mobilizing transposase RayT
VPNTYTRIYIHIVFAVRNRAPLIKDIWKNDLYGYITGIIKGKNQKLFIINGVADHIHMLLSIKPDCNVSELIRDIKSNSSRWVNESRYSEFHFQWQEGFAGFSLGHSQIERVINYIKNQEERHRKISFSEELVSILDAYMIEYKKEYLFND